MDSCEAFRIEPRLEVGERARDQIALAARVDARVVALGLNPVNRRDLHRDHPAALGYEQPVRPPPQVAGETRDARGDRRPIADARARPRERLRKALGGQRLDQIVRRVQLEGADGVSLVRGRENHGGHVDVRVSLSPVGVGGVVLVAQAEVQG